MNGVNIKGPNAGGKCRGRDRYESNDPKLPEKATFAQIKGKNVEN